MLNEVALLWAFFVPYPADAAPTPAQQSHITREQIHGAVSACARNCSGHGSCVRPSSPLAGATSRLRALVEPTVEEVEPSTGGCECHVGWVGHDCSLRACAGNGHCNGHGQCLNGSCACDPGYRGSACSTGLCDPQCENGGVCVAGGRCRCPLNFHGARCEVGPVLSEADHSEADQHVPEPSIARSAGSTTAAGPPCSGRGNCSSRGVCLRGTCACITGWVGPGCGERSCSEVRCAQGRGRCVRGTCRCRPPYLPPTCALGRCPGDCSGPGHGFCNASNARCTCTPGFTGPDCAARSRPSPSKAARGGDAVGPTELVVSTPWTVRLPPASPPTPFTLASPPPPSPPPPPPPPPLPPPPASPPPLHSPLSPPPLPALPLLLQRPLPSPPAFPSLRATEEESLGTDPLYCPLGCGASSGRGLCLGGTCFCASGWSGNACQRPLSASAIAESSSESSFT